MWDRRADLLTGAALVVAVLALYAPARDFGFVNYDDPYYVTENPHVAAGLRWSGVLWAFTAVHAANWHPLTWLSHMADRALFGTWAGGHHLTSVAIHAANAALLFGTLLHMTHARGRSAFVAAVFALHPLRVESVAWISERKDVLSGLCWILALAAFTRYVARPTRARYAAVAIAFAAGLLAKPMVVTLPAVLLLLDVWPLGRPWRAGLVWEKLPLVALTIAASAVTFVVQREAGAMTSVAVLPITTRFANALVAYATYVRLTLWPSGLAVFYPMHPLAAGTIATAAALLTWLTLVAVVAARRCPAVLVGWLWYLGTLVPVIGLVKVGDQAMADRFTYLPQIGLLLMLAWGVPDALAWVRAPRALASVGAALAVGACAVGTVRQLPTWHDSVALFSHAVAVTTDNVVAEGNLGAALIDSGRSAEAVPHLERAIALRPTDPRPHVALGRVRADAGDRDGAHRAYDDALRMDPVSPLAHYDLGVLLADEGRYADAIVEYRTAVRLAPDYLHARHNLGNALAASGHLEEAVDEYRALLAIAPDLASAHGNLGIALERLGRRDEAIVEYTAAVRLAPTDARARFNLAATLVGAGRDAEALTQLREAARLRPDWPEAAAAIAEIEGRAAAPHTSQP